MTVKKIFRKSSVLLGLLAIGVAPVTTLVFSPVQSVSAATVSKSPTRLAEDGVFGSATIADLQIYLNQNENAKLAVDGVFGTATIKAFQGMLGTTKDGVFGTASVSALQTFLNNLSTYWKGDKTSRLVVDGVFGSATISHLQAYLNMYYDL